MYDPDGTTTSSGHQLPSQSRNRRPGSRNARACSLRSASAWRRRASSASRASTARRASSLRLRSVARSFSTWRFPSTCNASDTSAVNRPVSDSPFSL